MNDVIFITKDATNKNSLPIYGNKFWKTPNIDELAKKGTIFNRHYTAGGSTAMSFTSMSLGKYCYETGRRVYSDEKSINGNTLFDKVYDMGYDCHIIWDSTYTAFAESHFKCEGLHTTIHSIEGIKQREEKHKTGYFDDVKRDEEEANIAIERISNELKKIKENANRPVFVWMHLPHVLRGCQGYCSDIDIFDQIIGIARSIYGDETISVSADHGHMNGSKEKYHYGFDVGEEVICIPLITPKIEEHSYVDVPTSNLQMFDILFNKKIVHWDFVISETAYYAQPKRKIAIIKGKYKYCFDKETGKEYLYDLVFDELENHNLVYPEFYDKDRFFFFSTAQCFYYPYWNESAQILDEFRKIKRDMWKNGTFLEEKFNKILHFIKCIYTRYQLAHPKNDIVNTGK